MSDTRIKISSVFGRIERRDWCVVDHGSYPTTMNQAKAPTEALDQD